MELFFIFGDIWYVREHLPAWEQAPTGECGSLVPRPSPLAHSTGREMWRHRLTYLLPPGDSFGDVMTFRAKSSEREENAWVLGWEWGIIQSAVRPACGEQHAREVSARQLTFVHVRMLFSLE